jgi:predicted Zn-dependent protease
VHPEVTAIAVEAGGRFETMRTLAPPAGRGYEYLTGTAWDFPAELAELPELLAAKLAAPSVRPGRYDLVIDPSNLFLTIHESIGHATELDRALGYEAACAGTSFATVDKLGSLQYGSPLMHVTGDRTAEHGLATIGYDDEGVGAQSWDLITGGVLTGYQLDRRMAALQGLGRSNGCAPFVIARASSRSSSVFDNGLALRPTEWISGGQLAALTQTRHSAQLSGLAVTPAIGNLILQEPGGAGSLEEMIAATGRGLLITCLWYIREVDPLTLLLTGLTRDGVYLVENGEVTGAVNNFRFNESPVAMMSRVAAAGATVPALPR